VPALAGRYLESQWASVRSSRTTAIARRRTGSGCACGPARAARSLPRGAVRGARGSVSDLRVPGVRWSALAGGWDRRIDHTASPRGDWW